jgi:nucleoside-diphosphate-sugar epimerase
MVKRANWLLPQKKIYNSLLHECRKQKKRRSERKKLRILVTGVSGFIGKNLIPLLVKKHEVRAFGRRRLQFKEVEFIDGDLRDFRSIRKALIGIDEIIHLGAITDTNEDPILTLDTNIKGTYNVAEAAAQVRIKRIIFASSIAAYGCLSDRFVPAYLPIDERHPCIPQDVYGLSKFLGEEIMKSYARKESITTISLRFGWVQDVRDLGTFRLPRKGTLWSTIDIRDIIKSIGLSLESDILGNEVINIATENSWTKDGILDLIKSNYPKTKIDEDYFLRNPEACLFDISKAKSMLGFKPHYELKNMQ